MNKRVVSAALVLILIAPICADEITGKPEEQSPSNKVTFIPARVVGTVYFRDPAKVELNSVHVGVPIPPESLIITGYDSYVDLCLSDGVRLSVRHESEALISVFTERYGTQEHGGVELFKGGVFIRTPEGREGQQFETKSFWFVGGIGQGSEVEQHWPRSMSVHKGQAVAIPVLLAEQYVPLIGGGKTLNVDVEHDPVDTPAAIRAEHEKVFAELRSMKCIFED